MHLFPIAHDGDMLKLVDIALHQEPDGRSDVLQVHARIQQLLDTARITTSLKEYSRLDPDP